MVMVLAKMALDDGYWPKWELDQVVLDEMGLDEVAVNQAKFDKHSVLWLRFSAFIIIPTGSISLKICKLTFLVMFP